MDNIECYLGELHLINDAPDQPLRYGIAVSVGDDIYCLSLRKFLAGCTADAAKRLLSGEVVCSDAGMAMRYLGPFQDTGEGSGHITQAMQ